MKITKGQQILDIKTGNSQMSNIDIFSKMQASFLQKFFKYNLSDYFSDHFANVYEDIYQFKMKEKSQKSLAASLFVVNKQFGIQEFENQMESFYRNRAKSLVDGNLPYSFKYLYSNTKENNLTIKQKQVVLVDIKIKAQVQKLQEIPQKILKSLNNYKTYKNQPLTQIQQILVNNKSQYINLFVIYFGDINFNIFNKKMYQIETVKIMDKIYKFRIFVFYISKQGLIQTFKSINKIESLHFINDLVIQFYELKREKFRRKRVKNLGGVKQSKKIIKEASGNYQLANVALGAVGVISLTVFGFAMKKLFL